MRYRRRPLELGDTPSPNLVPLMDIMFILLLFFMLSADMGHRELEDVTLAKAMHAQKDEQRGIGEIKAQRLTINIYHRYESLGFRCPLYHVEQVDQRGICRERAHWLIGIRGQDYTDMAKLKERLLQEAKIEPDPTDPEGKRSNRVVHIRADGSAPYEIVQKIYMTCAEAGMYKLEVGVSLITEPGG
jgi:biopolymer transport protein ExbD